MSQSTSAETGQRVASAWCTTLHCRVTAGSSLSNRQSRPGVKTALRSPCQGSLGSSGRCLDSLEDGCILPAPCLHALAVPALGVLAGSGEDDGTTSVLLSAESKLQSSQRLLIVARDSRLVSTT